ncbi:MAG TPA: hypothetical protein VK447_03865 [Myxococcaceae bacterium]|nr:hypothetical protein [Myxococcaceae bacterium]
MEWNTSDGGVVPDGEGLRKAVRWLSDRRSEDTRTPFWKLVEEASVRFSLSPLEEQFLMVTWTELARAEEQRH